MDYKDRRRFDMLTRVRDFGATHGDLFPDSSLAAEAFTAVATAVGDIETAAVAQSSAAVSARASQKRDARRALQERLVLLANTAQVLRDAEESVKAHFVVPKTTNDQRLLTTARQFVQHVAPLRAPFVAHGLPVTFADDLNVLIGRLERAVRDWGVSRDRVVETRGRIKQTLATAAAAIAQLDVIVANHLGADPVVSAVWARSRRIVYAAKPRKVTPEQEGATEPGLVAPTAA